MRAGSIRRDGTGGVFPPGDEGLDGRTPILMADGRTRPLHALRPGEKVYGSSLEGRYRRYVITEIVQRQELRHHGRLR